MSHLTSHIDTPLTPPIVTTAMVRSLSQPSSLTTHESSSQPLRSITASISSGNRATMMQLSDPPLAAGMQLVRPSKLQIKNHCFSYGYFALVRHTVMLMNKRVSHHYGVCRTVGCSEPMRATTRDDRLMAHLMEQHSDSYADYQLQCQRENVSPVTNVAVKRSRSNSSHSVIRRSSSAQTIPLIASQSASTSTSSSGLSLSYSGTSIFSTDDRSMLQRGDEWRIAVQESFAQFCAITSCAHHLGDTPERKEFLKIVTYHGHLPIPEEFYPPSLTAHVIKSQQKNIASLTRARIIEKLQGQTVTVAFDGWTDQHSAKILNVILCSGSKAYYWSSVYLGHTSTTGEAMADKLMPIIDDLLSANICIVAIVSDNEAATIAAQKQITSMQKCIHILNVRCAAHALNLVVRAIIGVDQGSELLTDVADITGFIRAKKLYRQAIIDIQRNQARQYRLQFANDTR
jgi:hypothetical protein